MTDLLSVDEARRRIVAMARQRPPGPVALIEAAGLVLATDEVARRDLPGFDNSAMDGFAVRAADLAGASDAAPARLRLAGEVAAGSVFAGEVEPGTAVRIMTGAPLPTGADAVIEVELTSPGAAPGGEGRDAAKDGSRLGAEVLAHARIDPGRNVRRAGSDIRAGDLALRAGTHLGPYQIALLAALGAAWPVCIPRPTIALLATGDELVDVADEPGPGQVVNIVGPGLGAAAAMAGAIPFRLGPARDTMDELRRSLAGAATADVVVSVGGVSMGEYDLVRRAVEEIGELDFWRVAMRPGKPLAVGGLGGKPFIGLPG
ncbi:MAG TPA: gephyrin-like molybdotransferase Glp, partial [Candidatus Dormibacteraeota bacterium]|nr:gephyrin-like molybdotransferase Glp [Candidatus Dormibacteraeota bacterium]